MPKPRRQVTDSTAMLEAAGLRAIDSRIFESPRWRVEPNPDSDYPWLLTDRVKGTRQACAALIECVHQVYLAEGLDLSLYR